MGSRGGAGPVGRRQSARGSVGHERQPATDLLLRKGLQGLTGEVGRRRRLTGDGLLDVAVGIGWSANPINGNKLVLQPQTASGQLGAPVRLQTGASSAANADEEMGMAAGDLDGDGRTDLVLATFAGVEVLLQRSGTLQPAGLIALTEAQQVSLVDLDGDADLDPVVDRRAGVFTLAGAGSGQFGPAVAVVDRNYKEIETADVTGDGRGDIVGITGAVVEVLARQADGTFANPVSYSIDDAGRGLAVGDLNGDGRNDVAVSVGMDSATAWSATSRATGSRISSSPNRTSGLVVVRSTVWTWGFNDWGQLGTGAGGFFDPVPRVAMDGATAIAAGANHSVAVAGFTEVYAWGLNHVGQLGDGTTTSRDEPTQSPNTDRIIIDVVAGWYHTVTVGMTGVASAWGWNYFGQLGSGPGPNALNPRPSPFMDPSALSAGVGHTVAVTARGG